MRSTSRLSETCLCTVLKTFGEVSDVCRAFHDANVVNIKPHRVECDELWSFIYAKKKNVTSLMDDSSGDLWIWIAIDPVTKLVIDWLPGKRDLESATNFLLGLKTKIHGKFQISTDGYKAYPEAIGNAFGTYIDYGQLEKKIDIRKAKKDPQRLVLTKKVVYGNPKTEYISTSMVERQNLTLRMGCRRFTRLTNAFSKTYRNHERAIALHYVYYNFIKIHQSIRVTPAMEAGITKNLMELADLIELAEEFKINRHINLKLKR
jgi:IS1 family transposase